MQIALRRSYATAGVALVGAGVIAMSPIAPQVPDMHPPTLQAPAVELTALPSWLQWVDDGTLQLQTQIAGVVAQLQSQIADPLPVLVQIARNQGANIQRLASAFTTSGGDIADGFVGAPAALLNAINDAIANPADIPAIVASLVNGAVQNVADAAAPVIDAVTAIATITVTRAGGAAQALAANIEPVTLATLTAPFAIGEQVVTSTMAVLAAVATLDLTQVIQAVGEGAFAIEGVAAQQFGNISGALTTLRDDVFGAVSEPLPAATMMARAAGPAALPKALKTFDLKVSPAAEATGKAAEDSTATKVEGTDAKADTDGSATKAEGDDASSGAKGSTAATGTESNSGEGATKGDTDTKGETAKGDTASKSDTTKKADASTAKGSDSDTGSASTHKADSSTKKASDSKKDSGAAKSTHKTAAKE
ncbi:hypothetical protein [Mycobacterium sp. URHB0021]